MIGTGAAPEVELQLLGPLQLVSQGQPQGLGGPRQRAISALLLIDRNRVVPIDALVDAVWGEQPPPAVVSSVPVAVSGMRRVLPPRSPAARASPSPRPSWAGDGALAQEGVDRRCRRW